MSNSAVVGLLRAILVADTAQYETAMARASKQADQFVKDFANAGRQTAAVGKALTTTITLPLVAAGAAVAKLAIDFESSFAGVRKTVDATDAELKQLSEGFRALAREIPINVNELNKIGEAAGALGIAKGDILDFTRTIALIGVTTNLTSQEAADAVARIQNIFGAAGKDTDRLASTLVALGNAGASTEKEIVEMGQRIAGAGHTIGLTQAQVLSFASTLASVGINAEAGGSAISRVFLKMNNAVMGGGAALKEFARVAGMSSADFKKAFEVDAAEATVQFIKGLARLKESGENINQTIEGLTGKNIILKDTLFRLAGSGELLTTQLQLGNKAWKDNTALTIEAGKRFDTTASQITLFWNRLKDVGITLGEAFKPAIKTAISVLEGGLPIIESLVKFFTGLPTGLQVTAIAFAGLVAAIGPVLWAAGELITATTTVTGAFGRKGIASKALAALLRDQATATDQLTAAQLRNAGAAGGGATGTAAAGAAGAAAGAAAKATSAGMRLVAATGVGFIVTETIAQIAVDRAEQAAKLHEIADSQLAIAEYEKQILETERQRRAAVGPGNPSAKLDEQLKALQTAKEKAKVALALKQSTMDVSVSFMDMLPDGSDAGSVPSGMKATKAPLTPEEKAQKDLEALLAGLTGNAGGKKAAVISPYSVKATTDAIKEMAANLALANKQGGIAKEQIPPIVARLYEWEQQGYKLDDVQKRLLNGNRDLNALYPNIATVMSQVAKGSKTLTDSFLGSAHAAEALRHSASLIKPTDWGKLLAGAVPAAQLEAQTADPDRSEQLRGIEKLVSAYKIVGSTISDIGRIATGTFGKVIRTVGVATDSVFQLALAFKTADGDMKAFANSAAVMQAGMMFSTFAITAVISDLNASAAEHAAFLARQRENLKRLREEFGLTAAEVEALRHQIRENSEPGLIGGWRARLDTILEKLAKAKDAIAGLSDVTQAFGGVVPQALRPMVEELLKMQGLPAQLRDQLAAFAQAPSWQTLQQRAEALGIQLSTLGQGFSDSRIADIALGYVRDLTMFKEAGANVEGVLAGMADELVTLVTEAAKSGSALPKTLEPYLKQLDAMGLLIDENGNKIELGALSFKDIEDESLKAVKDVLEQIRDLLAQALPQAAQTFAKSIAGIRPPAAGGLVPGVTVGDGRERTSPWMPRVISDEELLAQLGQMPGFAKGTAGKLMDFGSGTPVMLHGQEGVYTAADISRGGAAGGNNFYINAIDGQSFETFLRRGGADAVARTLTDASARYVGKR